MRLNLSLLARVLIALGLVGLLPLTISALQLISLNKKAVRDQVLQTHTLAVRTATDGIEAFLSTRIALAQSAAGNPTLADPRSPEAQTFLRQSLVAWSRLGVLAVAVVSPDGEEVIRAQVSGANDTVSTALDLSSTLSVVAFQAGDAMLVRVEEPLAMVEGFLHVVSDATRLQEILNPLALGTDAQMALVNTDGNLLAGSVTSLNGFPPQQLELARKRLTEGAKAFDSAGTTGILGAWGPVTSAEWAILSIQPGQIAEAAAHTMRRKSMWSLGGALLLIALLSAGSYASIIKPIRMLTDAQRRLVKGPLAAKTGNEIDDLKAAFEALEQSVMDREAVDKIFLGRYQVQELVGSGAMGTVFRGWDPKLKRPVALKTVRLGRLLTAEKRKNLIERLLAEAVTVARFSHPNIVNVYDVEDLPEVAFVAMEFIDGIGLEVLLFQKGRLETSEVILLGAAIAAGLSAAHQHGIVHRDIKPANILLGNDGSIKVTDFGIAELISSTVAPSTTVFGTPGYLPPETLDGEGYDKSGDLFALGVILYLGLTGTRPFEGKGVREIVRGTLFGEVQPIDELNPQVSPELEEIVLGLLVKDPRKRLSDAADVARRFNKMIVEGNLSWVPDWSTDRATDPIADHMPSQLVQISRISPR